MSKLKPRTTSPFNNPEKFPFLFSVTSITEKISQSQIPPKQSTLNPVNLKHSLPIQSQIFISIFKKCKNLNQIKQLHSPITTSGMLPFPKITNVLLCKYLEFDYLPNARLLFDRMPERNLISWNAMISGYVQDGDFYHCLITFRELIDFGVRPDRSTLIPVIKVCKNSMRFHMGRLVHCLAVKNGLNCDVVVRLFLMYAQNGMIEDAKKLFDEMTVKNIETWTIMIQKCAEFGNRDELVLLYARMREEGFSPNKAMNKAMKKANLIRDYTKEINIPKPVSITKLDDHLQYVKTYRQYFQEMYDKVNARLNGLNGSATQADTSVKDAANSSAVKHVRTESLLRRWWMQGLMISKEVLMEIKLFWRDMF